MTATLDLVASEGSIDRRVLWSFEPPPSERPKRLRPAELRGMGAASTRHANDLKKRCLRFVGPTAAAR